MDAGDHPEQDESDLLSPEEITQYQMLIGCAQWAVTLGRFDIQYATNTLARYASMPRDGYFKRCLRLFGYLKHNGKARILFDPSDPDYTNIHFEDDFEWCDLYHPEAQEDIPNDTPMAMTQPLQVTILSDASHASDYITRRSVTGYLMLVGKTPIRSYSKRQNTVETSTYGSEMVALRIAIEAAIDIRYKLRMMGMGITDFVAVLGDNQSTIVNTQFPSSTLKKKHVSVSFHKCREAVAAGFAKTAFIPSTMNISDILTKPKGPADHYRLIKNVLYGRQ